MSLSSLTLETVLSATPATQAANMAAAINASSSLKGVVKASSLAGVVTVVSEVPGVIGNGLQISEALANVTLSDFATEATGSDGDSVDLDFA